MSEYDGRQFVGIDLHRRRTVIVRQSEGGEQLGWTRIVNDPMALAAEIGKAGESPEVVLEATYGWYWAADVLAEAGAQVHLAHPLGIKGFAQRRVKNDLRDAADLADLLRMGRLPEAWIAPPEVRELRELVRHRAKLVAVRSGFKAGVHAVLAKQGLHIPVSDLFGSRGRAELDRAPLDTAYRARVNAYCRLIDTLDIEVELAAGWIAARLATHPGYRAIQQIPGVGPTWAAVFVAEIGDVTGSPPPDTCVRGPGSPRVIASPTPPCTAARSPNRAPPWSVGPRSRRCRSCRRARAGWSRRVTRSPPGGAATSPRWPSPGNC